MLATRSVAARSAVAGARPSRTSLVCNASASSRRELVQRGVAAVAAGVGLVMRVCASEEVACPQPDSGRAPAAADKVAGVAGANAGLICMRTTCLCGRWGVYVRLHACTMSPACPIRPRPPQASSLLAPRRLSRPR